MESGCGGYTWGTKNIRMAKTVHERDNCVADILHANLATSPKTAAAVATVTSKTPTKLSTDKQCKPMRKIRYALTVQPILNSTLPPYHVLITTPTTKPIGTMLLKTFKPTKRIALIDRLHRKGTSSCTNTIAATATAITITIMLTMNAGTDKNIHAYFAPILSLQPVNSNLNKATNNSTITFTNNFLRSHRLKHPLILIHRHVDTPIETPFYINTVHQHVDTSVKTPLNINTLTCGHTY